MCSQASRLLLIIYILWSAVGVANEDAHSGDNEHGVTKAEEQPGWLELEAQISSLEAKLTAKNRAIEALIEEKAHVKATSSKLNQIIEEIGKEDRERRQIAEQLEKQKTILHFRYPERGARKDRKYQRAEMKTVEDIESNLGIEGRLNHSLKKMRGQYGEEEKKKTGSPAKSPKNEANEEGSILMQK